MPTYRDKARGCFVFEFDRQIAGKRVRARKVLPKAWSKTQTDAFDRKESARLYALGSRIERPQHTIDDAVLVYLRDRVQSLKSGDNIERELAQLLPFYKGKPITELAAVCAEYTKRAAKADGTPLAPATLRNRIRYLTSACRYAWKRHAMCDHDPAERVVAPEVRNERHHFVGRRDMLRLARACTDVQTRAAIRIAFYSGMRLSEIGRAEVRDNTFMLADTKNGQRRHVPIHPKIRTCLGFGMPNQTTISKYFRRARATVGMEWLRFHDLRHSAASAMINSGIDLYTVGTVLGHKSPVSTRRYAHLATDSLRDAIGAIGKKIA